MYEHFRSLSLAEKIGVAIQAVLLLVVLYVMTWMALALGYAFGLNS